MAKRYSRLEREELARITAILEAEYVAGISVRCLASKYKISYGRTYRILKETGICMRPRGGWNRKAIPESGERSQFSATLVREYEAGISVRSLAVKHQISCGQAYRILKETGICMRPRGRWNRRSQAGQDGSPLPANTCGEK
jgi:Mor family transcriptional regulator